MKNYKGFTLIELIVTIVVLGILSVTAVPKFLSLQSDARAAVVKGVATAIVGGSEIVHAKSLLQKNDLDNNGYGKVRYNNKDIPVRFRYPSANLNKYINNPTKKDDFIKKTKEWVKIKLGDQLDFDVEFYNSNEFRLTLIGSQNPSKCYVTYKDATSVNNTPKIETITSGC